MDHGLEGQLGAYRLIQDRGRRHKQCRVRRMGGSCRSRRETTARAGSGRNGRRRPVLVATRWRSATVRLEPSASMRRATRGRSCHGMAAGRLRAASRAEAPCLGVGASARTGVRAPTHVRRSPSLARLLVRVGGGGTRGRSRLTAPTHGDPHGEPRPPLSLSTRLTSDRAVPWHQTTAPRWFLSRRDR